MPAFTWPDPKRQRLSHDAILEFYSGGSVLDVGCGMGELSERVSGRYVGIDMEPVFIEYARRRYPHCEFHSGGLENAPIGSFDYVIVIGPFAYRQTANYELDMESCRSLFRQMYGRSRIALLATFSSDWASVPYKAKRVAEMHFFDPAFWLTYAGQLSRRVVLKHDYLASEFVLAAFKEPRDWPNR